MGKYDDIIDIEWNGRRSGPRMEMGDRAKIFSPFAALRGYDDALRVKREMVLAHRDIYLEDWEETEASQEGEDFQYMP